MARYAGEIRGMLKLLADVNMDTDKMERFLLRDLKTHLGPMRHAGDELVAIDPLAVLYRAAAYLVVTGAQGSAELLYHVSFHQ